MAAAIKNHVVGPATLSVGGTDVGGIKKGTLEWDIEQDFVDIGDNEQYSGTVAVYRRVKGFTIKCVLQELSLANLKIAWGISASITAANPQLLSVDFETGMMTSAAIIITCAAPRTTAGVAQTRTITATAGVAHLTTGKYKMGVDGVNELDCEIKVLYSDGSGDIAISDVNA